MLGMSLVRTLVWLPIVVLLSSAVGALQENRGLGSDLVPDELLPAYGELLKKLYGFSEDDFCQALMEAKISEPCREHLNYTREHYFSTSWGIRSKFLFFSSWKIWVLRL